MEENARKRLQAAFDEGYDHAVTGMILWFPEESVRYRYTDLHRAYRAGYMKGRQKLKTGEIKDGQSAP